MISSLLLLALATLGLTLHLSHDKTHALEGDYILSHPFDKWNSKPKPTVINFDPSKGEVSFWGCNNNWGHYKTKGTHIAIDHWASTRMACSKDFDSDISGALSAATRFERKGDIMRFFKGNEETIRLEIKQSVLSGDY